MRCCNVALYVLYLLQVIFPFVKSQMKIYRLVDGLCIKKLERTLYIHIDEGKVVGKVSEITTEEICDLFHFDSL